MIQDSAPVATYRSPFERTRDGLGNALAVAGLGAIAIAYMMMFSVLGDTHYASKFENGALPAGVDPSAGQTAAVISLIAAACAVVAIGGAVGVRATKLVGTVAVVGVLAAVPYFVLELITWQLAF